jgi:hypothetical protein
MRINKNLPMMVMMVLVLLTLFSCKKDTTTIGSELETYNLPGIMMTLSAISYAESNTSEPIIRQKIDTLLADEGLITKGQWKRVWGPGISPLNVNLAYVAEYATENQSYYALVIRGTRLKSFFDDFEDLNVFEWTHFTYGQADDKVSWGAWDGFNFLLDTKDSKSGQTLQTFLNSIPGDSGVRMFVTGHSQGGSLAQVFAYWLKSPSVFNNKFSVSVLGFAGPSIGNQSFVTNYLNLLSKDESFHMYINSKDVIPRFWSGIPSIISQDVPVYVPSFYRNLADSIQLVLADRGIQYVNMVVADTIGFIPVKDTIAGLPATDSVPYYDHWMGVEHHSNNYLRLLGADTIPF